MLLALATQIKYLIDSGPKTFKSIPKLPKGLQ